MRARILCQCIVVKVARNCFYLRRMEFWQNLDKYNFNSNFLIFFVPSITRGRYQELCHRPSQHRQVRLQWKIMAAGWRVTAGRGRSNKHTISINSYKIVFEIRVPNSWNWTKNNCANDGYVPGLCGKRGSNLDRRWIKPGFVYLSCSKPGMILNFSISQTCACIQFSRSDFLIELPLLLFCCCCFFTDLAALIPACHWKAQKAGAY